MRRLLPFNNGDCVLAGSLGAGNDVRLSVRDSVLHDCSNNGLSLGSNVVNGSGPTRNLSLDVDRTVVTGNRGGNLGIRNFTALDSLSVKVQRSDLAGSSSLGSSVADVAVEDLGTTRRSLVDLGLGARRLVGCAGRPGPLRTLDLGGSLDAGAPLSEPPGWCG